MWTRALCAHTLPPSRGLCPRPELLHSGEASAPFCQFQTCSKCLAKWGVSVFLPLSFHRTPYKGHRYSDSCQKWKAVIYGAKPLRNNDDFGRTGDISVPASVLRNWMLEEIAALAVWVKGVRNSHHKELSVHVLNCRVQNKRRVSTRFSLEQGFLSDGCWW